MTEILKIVCYFNPSNSLKGTIISPHCGLLLSVGRTRRVHVSSNRSHVFQQSWNAVQFPTEELPLSFLPCFLLRKKKEEDARDGTILRRSINRARCQVRFECFVANARSGFLLVVNDGSGTWRHSGRAHTRYRLRARNGRIISNFWFTITATTFARASVLCKSDSCLRYVEKHRNTDLTLFVKVFWSYSERVLLSILHVCVPRWRDFLGWKTMIPFSSILRRRICHTRVKPN